MYGMIHQAARNLAVSHLGQGEWDSLVEQSGLSERHFIGVEYYSDKETFRLVELISERLDRGMDETFYAFGRYWIDFAAGSAYGLALKLAGSDLETFISNLDRMHASIKSNMPRAALPGFEVVESNARAIRVVYRSERNGLAPFVRGILSAVAERFGERVQVSYVERADGVLFLIARNGAEG